MGIAWTQPWSLSAGLRDRRHRSDASDEHRQFSSAVVGELPKNDWKADHFDRFVVLSPASAGLAEPKLRLPSSVFPFMLRSKDLYASSDAEKGREADYRERDRNPGASYRPR